MQTDFPEHPVYRALVSHDYARFADELVAERMAAQLPPATHIALLVAEAHARADVDRFLDAAAECARAMPDAGGRDRSVSAGAGRDGAARGFERGQVLVQCARRAPLHAFLPALARRARDDRGGARALGARRRSRGVLTSTRGRASGYSL